MNPAQLPLTNTSPSRSTGETAPCSPGSFATPPSTRRVLDTVCSRWGWLHTDTGDWAAVSGASGVV